MNAERRQEISDDVARELRPAPVRRCQVAEYATGPLTAVAPSCGQVATHWSDDVSEGATVWMCSEHMNEILLRTDSVEMHAVDDE